MIVGVVGLGLIGGSIAMETKRLGNELLGFDESTIHQEKALDKGLVDSINSLDEIIERADLIVVATPVSSIAGLLTYILDRMRWGQVLFDVGSTKNSICEAVRNHSKRERYVAAHPLAGTEFSGPNAALLDLFKAKKLVICEEELSAEDALEMVIGLFNTFGMQSIFMDVAEHDKHMAYVSHLSHISAFALSRTVLAIEKDQKQIFNLASTGFASTVRLAKSNPVTWSAIFEHNAEHLSVALGEYIKLLSEFKHELDTKNVEKMGSYIEEANEIKRVLNGIKLNIVKLS